MNLTVQSFVLYTGTCFGGSSSVSLATSPLLPIYVLSHSLEAYIERRPYFKFITMTLKNYSY